MKKLSFIVILAFLVSIGIVSCSKDNDDVKDSGLVGKWQFEHFRYDDGMISFNSDGTFLILWDWGIVTSGEEEESWGTYEVKGNTLKLNFQDEEYKGTYMSGTYSISGRTLTYEFTLQDPNGRTENSSLIATRIEI